MSEPDPPQDPTSRFWGHPTPAKLKDAANETERLFALIVTFLTETLPKWLGELGKVDVEAWDQSMLDLGSKVTEKFLAGLGLDASIVAEITKRLKAGTVGDAPGGLMGFVSTTWAIISTATDGLKNLLVRKDERDWSPIILPASLSASDVLLWEWKVGIGPFVKKYRKEAGWTQDRWEAYGEAHRPVLSPADAIGLFLMGEIDDDYARLLLRGNGYVSKTMQNNLSTMLKRPLGVGDALELKRRGELDDGDYNRYLAHQRLDAKTRIYLSKLEEHLPGVSELLELRRRNLITDPDVDSMMRKLGYRGPWARRLRQSWRRYLPFTTAALAFHRVHQDPDVFMETMQNQGYTVQDSRYMLEAAMHYPSPQDVIQMAMHEVWTPVIDKKFNLGGDFPEPAMEWAKKIGISRPVMELYWKSHWRLIGPDIANELRHRGLITDDELGLILRAWNVNPWLRDKMVQAVYRRIPRRGLYRMYKLGIFNEIQLAQRYQVLGYNRVDAVALAQTTVKRSAEPDRELTKSEIANALRRGWYTKSQAVTAFKSLDFSEDAIRVIVAEALRKKSLDEEADQGRAVHSAADQARELIKRDILRMYADGMIDRDTAMAKLVDSGTTAVVAHFQLAHADLEIRTDDLEYQAKQIHRLFDAGVSERDHVIGSLSEIGYTPTASARLANQWDLDRDVDKALAGIRNKQPTRPTINRWLHTGIIEVEKWVRYMMEMGYPDDVIRLYLIEEMATPKEY